MIHILHLCSYYTGSTVYRDLINELATDERIASQFVFSPIRSAGLNQKNPTTAPNVRIYYAHCQNLLTRLSFFFKQLRFWRAFFASSAAREALEGASVAHAHTLYADGVLAYLMFRLYKKPYVVTVRGTDLNLGDRFFILWRPLIKAVLRNARHVFFMSPSQLELAKRRYSRELRSTSILANGLDPYWLENLVSRKPQASQNSVLTGAFIGAINRNKNLKATLEAFHLAASGAPYRFLVLGGTYADFQRVYGNLDPSIRSQTTFSGFISDKPEIRDVLASADIFVMPSFSETFGLTYLEAISQATPVVYSKNQGIDGYSRAGETGYACSPNDVHSIATAIRRTLDQFPHGLQYARREDNPASRFSWHQIAANLIDQGYKGADAP